MSVGLSLLSLLVLVPILVVLGIYKFCRYVLLIILSFRFILLCWCVGVQFLLCQCAAIKGCPRHQFLVHSAVLVCWGQFFAISVCWGQRLPTLLILLSCMVYSDIGDVNCKLVKVWTNSYVLKQLKFMSTRTNFYFIFRICVESKKKIIVQYRAQIQ